MKLLKDMRLCRRFFILLFIASLLLIAPFHIVNGQEKPPRPITVTVNLVQDLNFGTFYHGNAGGTVIIYPDGSRSSTGEVVILSSSFTPALFDVVGNQGTLVSILDSPDATLNCVCGGTLTLRVRQADSNPTIITSVPPASTQVKVGGTLYVSNSLANPPGNYSGTFAVTFVQE
jgi:hypothetical protein